MRLERVGMQSDHRQEAAPFSDKLADTFVCCIVESALWQNDCHAAAGTKEV
jgi:hypothetical protein